MADLYKGSMGEEFSLFTGFLKGKVMKKTFVCRVIFGIVLCSLIFGLSGCGSQPGETRAEGSRRHMRNARINREGLMKDLDDFMMMDQPSQLSEHRTPPEVIN